MMEDGGSMEDGLANLKEPLRTGLVLHQVQEDICTEDSIKIVLSRLMSFLQEPRNR